MFLMRPWQAKEGGQERKTSKLQTKLVLCRRRRQSREPRARQDHSRPYAIWHICTTLASDQPEWTTWGTTAPHRIASLRRTWRQQKPASSTTSSSYRATARQTDRPTGPSLVTNVTLERDYVNRVALSSLLLISIPLSPSLLHCAVLSDMLLNRPCRALTVLRPDFALSFAFLERFIELFLIFSCFWVLSPLFTLIPSAFTRSTLHWHRFRCCCFVLLSRSADWSFAADSGSSSTEQRAHAQTPRQIRCVRCT